jgi:hypothetical protein
MPGKPGGFQPGRVMINLILYDEDDPQKTPITTFNPAIEVRFRYTAADLQQAAGNELELAYWMDGEWHKFTSQKHNFRLEPNSNPQSGGFGVVEIKKWGDPPIAWGW